MPHPYFVAKARAVFERAGGDPDNAGPLAEWAERARTDPEAGLDSRDGVVVTDEGIIIAATRHTPSTPTSPGATYVTQTDLVDGTWPIKGSEIGGALGSFRRLTGRQVIHVTYSEVCVGRGRPPEFPSGGKRVSTTLSPEVIAKIQAAADASGRSLDREIAARLAGLV